MSNKTVTNLGFTRVHEIDGVTEYKFDANGLKVLLVENHSAPVVTTMVVYRVGSRNEAVGYTGSTHFLEHMMFKGTVDRNPAQDRGIDDLLKPVGAYYNATTSYDRTNYFEAVPKEHLKLTLEIEADRMRNLVLTHEDRNSEMTVVRNEFERGENDPSDVMYKEMMASAFREHPYHHPVIGWRSDVEGVPMEKMKEFYDTFYWPNNATVILVGDFDSLEALEMIAETFGKFPASPKPIPEVYTTEPAQEGEKTFKVQRISEDMPQVWIGFKVPGCSHEDTYPLAVMASLLGDSSKRNSRLYKAVVETGLAVQVGCYAGENRDPGLFIVYATCAPGVTPEVVQAAILKAIADLSVDTVADKDLWLVKAANRKATALQRDDSVSFANLLCSGEASADWRWSMTYDDKYDAVTPEDVQAVASKYFGEKNRTVGYFVPEAPPAVVEKKAEVNTFAAKVKRVVLENGLTVLAMSTPGTGTASVSGYLRAGEYFGEYQKALVPELTAYLLTKGSTNKGKVEIAEALSEMGASMSFRAGTFAVTFGSKVVSRDLPSYLNLLGDVLRHPKFDEAEVAQSKKEFTAFVKSGSSNTGKVANAKLSQAVYEKTSVFHQKPFEELLAELPGITRDDLAAFHAGHYSPKGLILALVGDFDVTNVEALLPESLKSWEGVAVKEISVATTARPASASRINVAIPGKANADIVIGMPVELKRSASDFFAARLANAALGQDTLSSRLGLVVREKHGLTYGIGSSYQDVSFGNGLWSISLSVNPENIEKALGLVAEVVEKYRAEGISEKEFADEKGRAYGGFVVSLRNSLGIANVLSQFEFLGLPISDLDGIKAAYDSVTIDQVNEAIKKYLDLSSAVTVVAGSIEQ